MKKAFMSLAFLLCSFLPAHAAEMPKEGDAAPAFTLQNQDGKETSLESFKGKWVVLYFYPKDHTPGCSLQAHNFQRDLQKYTDKNAVIVGVSVDDAASHKEFCTKQKLEFTLLADTEKKVSEAYDSLMLGGLLSARNTFLIDDTGIVRKVYPGVKPATHSDEVLADLAALQAK